MFLRLIDEINSIKIFQTSHSDLRPLIRLLIHSVMMTLWNGSTVRFSRKFKFMSRILLILHKYRYLWRIRRNLTKIRSCANTLMTMNTSSSHYFRILVKRFPLLTIYHLHQQKKENIDQMIYLRWFNNNFTIMIRAVNKLIKKSKKSKKYRKIEKNTKKKNNKN